MTDVLRTLHLRPSPDDEARQSADDERMVGYERRLDAILARADRLAMLQARANVARWRDDRA